MSGNDGDEVQLAPVAAEIPLSSRGILNRIDFHYSVLVIPLLKT
jgi:hypothetical protein